MGFSCPYSTCRSLKYNSTNTWKTCMLSSWQQQKKCFILCTEINSITEVCKLCSLRRCWALSGSLWRMRHRIMSNTSFLELVLCSYNQNNRKSLNACFSCQPTSLPPAPAVARAAHVWTAMLMVSWYHTHEVVQEEEGIFVHWVPELLGWDRSA